MTKIEKRGTAGERREREKTGRRRRRCPYSFLSPLHSFLALLLLICCASAVLALKARAGTTVPTATVTVNEAAGAYVAEFFNLTEPAGRALHFEFSPSDPACKDQARIAKSTSLRYIYAGQVDEHYAKGGVGMTRREKIGTDCPRHVEHTVQVRVWDPSGGQDAQASAPFCLGGCETPTAEPTATPSQTPAPATDTPAPTSTATVPPPTSTATAAAAAAPPAITPTATPTAAAELATLPAATETPTATATAAAELATPPAATETPGATATATAAAELATLPAATGTPGATATAAELATVPVATATPGATPTAGKPVTTQIPAAHSAAAATPAPAAGTVCNPRGVRAFVRLLLLSLDAGSWSMTRAVATLRPGEPGCMPLLLTGIEYELQLRPAGAQEWGPTHRFVTVVQEQLWEHEE